MTTRIAHSDFFDNRKYRETVVERPKVRRYNNNMPLRIKEIRKAKGLTQMEVARAIGLSQSYFTEMETGRKEISVNRLEMIAKALGVSPYELLIDEENPEQRKLISLLSKMSEDQKLRFLQLAESFVG